MGMNDPQDEQKQQELTLVAETIGKVLEREVSQLESFTRYRLGNMKEDLEGAGGMIHRIRALQVLLKACQDPRLEQLERELRTQIDGAIDGFRSRLRQLRDDLTLLQQELTG